MKILVINTGSSSLKYQLIDGSNELVLAKGLVDRIGIDHSFIKQTVSSKDPVVVEKEIYNHKVAIKEVINMLTCKTNGVISSMDEITAVGHRVVHGGEKFHDSVLINDEVLQTIRDCVDLAPLHNPPNIVGIEACMQIMPNIQMVAVFDTAFHQTIPQHAYVYALPYEMYEKYGIRKYGFHGTSHQFVARRAAELLGKPFNECKIISCHLGNGSSICAIKNGKSYDTSMGFTPLAGLAMGTRSGTIDPYVVKYLMDKEGMDIQEVMDFLNKKSGVLGLSGISSDFRDLQEAAEDGNERANLALDVFCYRVKKFIGEYAAAINGVDAVVFTAGIGENNSLVRKRVASEMEYLGMNVDLNKNELRGIEIDISVEGSKVKTYVIPTNEELAIARETMKVLKY